MTAAGRPRLVDLEPWRSRLALYLLGLIAMLAVVVQVGKLATEPEFLD